MSVVDRSVVTSAVLALLEAELAFPIGVGEVPTPVLDSELEPNSDDRLDPLQAFGVLLDVPPTVYGPGGYFGQPEAMQTIRYYLIGGGYTPEQASWAASAMSKVLVERDSSRSYVNALAPDGHTIIERHEVATAPGQREAGAYQSGRYVDVRVSAD